MKLILRYFAAKALSEHIDPCKKGFFQSRFIKDSLARYRFARLYVKDKLVLDLACGEGYGSYLLSKVARNVVGVDISDNVIKQANENYKVTGNSRLQFICDDALEFLTRTNKYFDVIISFETIEHVKDYIQLISLFYKRLKHGGILIISTPNKKFTDFFFGQTTNPYHLKEFYTQELADILTDIFHIQPEIYRQRPILNRHLFFSTIKSFLLKETSKIAKNDSTITGLDNIYVIMKPNTSKNSSRQSCSNNI